MKKSLQMIDHLQEMMTNIRNWCETNRNADKAPAMRAYMKDQFEFYGISAPQRKTFIRDFKTHFVLRYDSGLWDLIYYLWNDPYREEQYMALDILAGFRKKLQETDICHLEKLIITKSWWDTVDSIATVLVGAFFLQHPESKYNYVYRWMESDNIWLQRTAIIFQLKYGKQTDWDLLCTAILKNDKSDNFFVRKGQGWALRQYSRHAPQLVKEFIEANPQLSGLTKKEALRLL